jgi:hypothetical protein
VKNKNEETRNATHRCVFHGRHHRSLQHRRLLRLGGGGGGRPACCATTARKEKQKPLVRNGMRRRGKLGLRLERNDSPRRDGAGGDGGRWREWGRRGFAEVRDPPPRSIASASASTPPLCSSRLWKPFLSPDLFRF